jgi:hypothetical protein
MKGLNLLLQKTQRVDANISLFATLLLAYDAFIVRKADILFIELEEIP